MDFIVYLKTTEEYEPSDVVVAIHKALEQGASSLNETGNNLHANILMDILDNNPIAEQEES